MNSILHTADGSVTLQSNRFKETYHSTFGAIQESEHIFIEAGLNLFLNSKVVNLLEIGFGTGLNAFLSLQWAELNSVKIHYSGIEAYPVDIDAIQKINYPDILSMDRRLFNQLHLSGKQVIGYFFQSEVFYTDFQSYKPDSEIFDLIFFDAFSPDIQPEMWATEKFKELFKSLKPGGVLVTYSSKGIVKRALKDAGFEIKKLPGPPGKREFVRAMKNSPDFKTGKTL
ncbi:MAG: tRNA (5-methylaminomethyl-2-thiouridine)(34)-methyltransferase MnmD [Bacteroidales bacterium]|nr:tRNA (5-methylaminomethyl-2-thiouridine)(34)-methyltransferase MnmD [Bacteroidales bacterium]